MTITTNATFHGYTDIENPMKVSVPLHVVRPSASVPGRVFYALTNPRIVLDALTVGREYVVDIDTQKRTATIVRNLGRLL